MHDNDKTLLLSAVVVLGVVVLLVLTGISGCGGPSENEQALQTVQDALQLVEDAWDRQTWEGRTAALLCGLGFIIAIGLPSVVLAAVLVGHAWYQWGPFHRRQEGTHPPHSEAH